MENFLALAAVIINQNQDVSNLRAVADRVHTSVVEVRADREGEGATFSTGVLIGRGLALTAFHAVAVAGADGSPKTLDDIVAIVYGRGEIKARTVVAVPELDLAILRLEGADLPEAAPLARIAPSVGDRLVAMGASSDEIVAAGITVSQESDDGSLVVVSTRSIDSRFWGGPVFDGYGQLAAVILTSLGELKAVSVSAILPLIERAAASASMH